MRHFNKILSFGLVALASLGFGACSDDWLDGITTTDGLDPDTQLVLELALPEQGGSTRADMSVSGDEGKINNLHLIVFNENGSLAKKQELPISDLSSITGSNGLSTFQVKGFNPGKYWIYVVANMGDKLANVQTEKQLKDVVNEYSNNNNNLILPQAGNLPMIYEPGGQLTEIDQIDKDPKVIETSLKIAAVKVKYNIIFDKEKIAECASIFGTSGLKINSISVGNVAQKAYLVQNTSVTNIGVFSFKPSYSFYNAYSEDPQNESVDNKDVISVSNPGSPNLNKWVCSGTLYLPERYVASGAAPTTMTIDATVLNAAGNDSKVKCSYSINLARHNGDKNAVSMPRDTYYEVIAKVKSLGTANLDTYTVTKEWSSVITRATFSGTYLTLSKTSGEVTSLTNDEITYTSDAKGDPRFECETMIGDESAILGEINPKTKTIKFSVNPKVSIENLPNNHGEGVALCWVQSGNIRKLVRIKYDITPFFIIDPLETKVQWSDNDQLIRTKEYSYRTNLGGLTVTVNNDKGIGTQAIGGANGATSYVSTIGNSKLQLTCSSPTAAMGTLKVTATVNPQTTTVHEFDAYPTKAISLSKYVDMKKDLRITVMPPLGGYRIYFRAINDWHKFDGGDGNISSEWLESKSSFDDSVYPFEDNITVDKDKPCNNWIDYWYVNGYNGKGNYSNNGYFPHNSSHRIYIWTQTGERVGVDDDPPVWRFTNGYGDAPSMNGDYTNPGWYYYDLSATAYQSGHSGGASGNKVPEPGTTLMIFHNTTNANDHGFTVHRVPGHLEPGVPLFDYEDREGWVLYDPTTESLYRVFDEKPIIDDVKYTIYSDVKPTGWWRKYGIATKQPSGSDFPQYTIYSNNVSNVTQLTVNGKTYYKYEIRMKAPRGYHAKAININFGGTTGGGTTSGQRVWYYSKNGWENPRVYVYSGDQKNAEWNSTPSMTKDRTEGGGTYYYYDIPSNLSNGQVIFQNSDRSQQNPAQNQAGRSLGGKSMVYYADSGSWMVYPGSTSVTSSSSSSSKLFGGRQFAGDTGTYNSASKTWTVGAPK